MKNMRIEDVTKEQLDQIHKWFLDEKKKKAWICRQFIEKYNVKCSVPTLRKLLELYPRKTEKPHLIQPKQVQDFRASEGWQKIKGHKYESGIESTLYRAWLLLDKYDPLTWTPEMIKSLRQENVGGKTNSLYRQREKDISEKDATELRRAIRAMHKGEAKDILLDELEDVTGAAHGQRLEWFLDDIDIIALCQKIKEPDTLIYTLIAFLCGGRPSSLCGYFKDTNLMMTTDKIEMKRHSIKRWENKVKTWSYPKFFEWALNLVDRYQHDYAIPFGAKILPNDVDYYSTKVKDAGLDAGITRFKSKGAAAYVLRHTFATQGKDHGLSLEVQMIMGGWLDASTMKAFYTAIPEEKLDREVLDIIITKPKTWTQWWEPMRKPFEDQYDKIHKAGTKIEYHATKEPISTRPKKTIVVNWDSKRALVKAARTPEKLKKYWTEAIKLHEQGLTYTEIRRQLKA